jgi:Cu2+-exporting ATPase
MNPTVPLEVAGRSSLHLVVENMGCPSCIQKIEGALRRLPGVSQARVNFSTQRLQVDWQGDALTSDDIIEKLSKLGHRAVPYDPARLVDETQKESKALLRALGVAGFAAANVMLLSVSVWAGLDSDMGPGTRSLFHWISALIALPAVAYAGRPFFRSALTALAARRLNMDVPISLAVLLATGLSLYRSLAGEELVYFDAALMLLFFLLIGRFLDRQARRRARAAGLNLLAMRAVAAEVIEPSGLRRKLPVEQIVPGMRLAVACGDRIPADGVIQVGRSELDASLVTGETLPQAVVPGDAVFAGTLNLSAPLEVRVTASEADSLLAEIVRLMEAAEQRRGRYVGLAERASRIYAPAVHLLAFATFAAWLLFAAVGWEAALMNAVAVLIITCPCALGLAVPTVQVVAIGRLLRRGILTKAGDALERLAEVDSVVLDKTGTLTQGVPRLANADEFSHDDLQMAASLATISRHPLSRALVAAAGPVIAAKDVEEQPGRGLRAMIEGVEVRLGSPAWCGLDPAVVRASAGAGSTFWFQRQGSPAKCFCFADDLRPEAAETLAELSRLGLSVELLSGDRSDAVAAIARQTGIEVFHAEQRPDDKIAHLEALRRQGRKVLMVGDGLNDAPALAAAHVSMSPSSAADISQTTADFVFQGESLSPLIETYLVASKARRLILQNFALAALYNLIALPLAMAGLVTPLVAAVAMSSSSLVVTLNALRLHSKKVPPAASERREEAAWKPSFT